MYAGKTYSDARVVGNNPSKTSGSDEQLGAPNITKHLIRSQPSHATKEPPDVDCATVPLLVSVKTGTEFFSNPEYVGRLGFS